MVSERSQSQNMCHMIPLYEIFRTGKFIETRSGCLGLGRLGAYGE